MSARDDLVRTIWNAEAEDRGSYTAGVTSEAAHNLADALLAAGYRKPRTITTVEEAEALPTRTMVYLPNGYMLEHLSDGWYRAGVMHAYRPNKFWVGGTVLHEPEADR